MTTTDQRRRQSRTAAVVREQLNLDLTSKRPIVEVEGSQLFAVPAVVYGMVAVRGREVYIHQETWDTIRAGGKFSIDGFFASFMREDVSDGLRALNSNVNWWTNGVVAENTSGTIHAKDRLTTVEERLVRLTAMASDFAGQNVDRDHLKMFVEQLNELSGDLDETEARVRHMRGMMQLARVVVGGL